MSGNQRIEVSGITQSTTKGKALESVLGKQLNDPTPPAASTVDLKGAKKQK